MRILSILSLALLLGCDSSGKDTAADPVDADGDGFFAGEDCDDTNDGIHPDAIEVCDGTDNDCDGEIDEGDAANASTWYQDADSDGYGDLAQTAEACEQPNGYVALADDCDDGDPAAFPGADEVCDGADNDCDEEIDEKDAQDATTWYPDADGDGHGVDSVPVSSCEQPKGYAAAADDCDDQQASVHPGADEYCDGLDNDCDDQVDERDALDATTWFTDFDGDGYGDPKRAEQACDQPKGMVDNPDDCDDISPSIHPDAEERCDDEDNDCDEENDEDAVDAGTWYQDSDGDGHGDADSSQQACDQPSGHVVNDNDCDDGDAAINPAAEEICDGIDNDCDSGTSEGGVVTLDGASNFWTIQSAVNSASSGSTVLVCDGTYAENVEIDQDLTLSSLNGASSTEIDGSASMPCLTLSAGAVTVTGFSLTNGQGGTSPLGGGGLQVNSTDAVVIDQCEIFDNAADWGGGVYLGDGAAVTISDSNVGYNDAEDIGGGIYMGDGSYVLDAVEVQSNLAGVDGGGIYLLGGTLSMNAVTIESNMAEYGGGMTSYSSEITASSDTLLEDNVASYWGGGMFFWDNVTWSGGVVNDNSAEWGGGLMFYPVEGGSVGIDATAFTDNAADYYGGGVFFYGDATVSDTDITGNAAAWGAGLMLAYGSTTSDACTVTQNQAGISGGGAYVGLDSILLVTASDWGSKATDNSPDDVYVEAGDIDYASYGAKSYFTCSDTQGYCY